MPLLPAALSDRLRCPVCGGAELGEHECPHDPGSGTVECAACGRHHLVVDRVAVLTAPVPPPPEGERVLEWAERDADARAVVHAALGRFAEALGGLTGCREQAGRDSLEQAFTVPGALWIEVDRFDWSQQTWIVRNLSGEGAVLDIGCGYGSSTVPFARAGREAVGVDENLMFMLLFSRYAREHDLERIGLVCADAARLPLPFGDAAFGDVLTASFFNHYVCLRSREELRGFLGEAARVVTPGGGFAADMVPNRLHPFPSEVNVKEVIGEVRLQRLTTAVIRALPLRWLPGRLTVTGLWSVYRAYCAVRRRPAPGLAAFRNEVSKAVPEAAVSGLPLRAAGWPALAQGFSHVEAKDMLDRGTGPRRKYFVLSCRR